MLDVFLRVGCQQQMVDLHVSIGLENILAEIRGNKMFGLSWG
jgi:hypothetical protein